MHPEVTSVQDYFTLWGNPQVSTVIGIQAEDTHRHAKEQPEIAAGVDIPRPEVVLRSNLQPTTNSKRGFFLGAS